MKKKVLIISGGISKERLISLDTGLQVAKELKNNGYKVKISEPDNSLAGKIKGIDSGVGISIVSIAVYGTFMGAPASLGLLANSYGVNNIFLPMLLLFVFLLIPIKIFKNVFKL